ncbi:MAG: ketoacyl-ACP synthase III [Bacteroidales bacterium]|nr:ketoacyl-ACP synthase III [Bacteroidales bacterium]
METYIKALSYYLPEKVLTNEELVKEFPEWSVEKVSSKIGISQRHIAAPNETAGDMAFKAANKLFEENKISPADIDFLMLCTQSPDYFLPTTACIIQDRLNLPTSAGALDFNLGCSGYIYGLALAKGLIVSGIARNVLLLTSETYTKHIHTKDKGNRTIFGDAAAATLISTEGFAKIGEFSLGTDGSGAQNLITKTGAFRQTELSGNISYDENGNPVSDDFLYMDGSEIFSFTQEIVPVMVEDLLARNNVSKEDINLFVFHQANKFMLNFLRKKMKIDENRFFYFMESVGNTVSSTIPIALTEARKSGDLKGKIMLSGFGVGYSWGGTILDID